MKSYRSDPIDNLSMAQTLLVHACLATNRADREHYVRAWEDAVQITDLDFSSSRLVPYFLHKNQQDGIACRHDKRLKVIYKHWWLRTQHINHQLNRVHEAFTAAGMEVVVIKGAALKHHYERGELRPMGDFDLLIPREKLHDAMGMLRALDFIPKAFQVACFEETPDLLLDFTHAMSWAHSDHETYIDLHWRVGSRCSEPFTAKLWHNLVPYQGIAGGRKPALAFEVVMVLIHAMDSSNKDNLNWMIDMAVLSERLDNQTWKDARQLAVEEKKVDLFDYACSVLLQFGLAVPDPGYIRQPRRLSAKPMERGGSIQKIRNLPRSVWTLVYTVDRLYPHAGFFGKGIQLMRRLKLTLSMERIRRRYR